jgi:Fe-S-cluster containining protein
VPDYDCQTCGTCCHSPWTGDGYVRLYEEDEERLRPYSLPVIDQPQGNPGEFVRKLGTMFDTSGRRVCVGFTGTPGESCACRIYADRPFACRHYEVGGVLCRESRERFGLPV